MCLYLISHLVNYIVMSCFHYLDRSLEIKGGLLFTNKIIPDLFYLRISAFLIQSKTQLTHSGILSYNIYEITTARRDCLIPQVCLLVPIQPFAKQSPQAKPETEYCRYAVEGMS